MLQMLFRLIKMNFWVWLTEFSSEIFRDLKFWRINPPRRTNRNTSYDLIWFPSLGIGCPSPSSTLDLWLASYLFQAAVARSSLAQKSPTFPQARSLRSPKRGSNFGRVLWPFAQNVSPPNATEHSSTQTYLKIW